MSIEQFEDILRVKGIKAQGYGIIPKIPMRDIRLPAESKAIYAYICSFAGNGDTAFPGVELMIKEIGMAKNRFYKFRKYLIDLGYLTITRERIGRRWGKNIYEICDKPAVKKDIKESTQIQESIVKISLRPQFEDIQVRDTHSEDIQIEDTINNSFNNNSLNNNRENSNSIKICVETGVPTQEEKSKYDSQKTKKEKSFALDSVEYLSSKYLADKILGKNPNANVPKTDKELFKWCVHIDGILRIDKKPVEEFKQVLKFATSDSFWSSNILSTKKLREKYDQLYAKMKIPKQQSNTQNRGVLTERENKRLEEIYGDGRQRRRSIFSRNLNDESNIIEHKPITDEE